MLTTETVPRRAVELIADVVAVNSRSLAATTNFLIDQATAERDKLAAELAAVREGVMALFLGPFMPTQRAIEYALFPCDSEIDRFRRDD